MAIDQKMLDTLETLKSLDAYKTIQQDKIDAVSTLTQFLDQVASEKERMTLTYNKNVFLAVVPIEDVKVIEQLEDCIDNADANDALKDKDSIPWEQVKKELEL
ncbi:MAG: hypothetical protein KAI83_04530 [Thiomargarita sp.]|nr:hypothetical protein [Thiomargarita sp.]